jgi:hypothetical protein
MDESARLGVFWFVPATRAQHRLYEFSRNVEDIPSIGGFRTLDEGHVDIWPTLVKRDFELSSVGYEHFPRGRVNWREDDEKFLLLADRYIFANGLHQVIIEQWNLPISSVLLLTDAHYKSQIRS